MFGSFRDTEEISAIFLMFCNWVLVVSVFDSSTFLFLFYYYYYYYFLPFFPVADDQQTAVARRFQALPNLGVSAS